MKMKVFYSKALYTANDVVMTVHEHQNPIEDFMKDVDVVEITQSSSTVPMGFNFKIVTVIVVWYEEKKLPCPERKVAVGLYGRSVDEISLSSRTANALNNANILSLGMLCRKTEKELLKHKNLGHKGIREIKDKLKSLELSLGMALPLPE